MEKAFKDPTVLILARDETEMSAVVSLFLNGLHRFVYDLFIHRHLRSSDLEQSKCRPLDGKILI